jgi:hypothetical protein
MKQVSLAAHLPTGLKALKPRKLSGLRPASRFLFELNEYIGDSCANLLPNA